MNHTQIENHIAAELVTTAKTQISWYVEKGDVDAATCAVLARALEVASGKTLKALYEIYQNTTATD